MGAIEVAGCVMQVAVIALLLLLAKGLEKHDERVLDAIEKAVGQLDRKGADDGVADIPRVE